MDFELFQLAPAGNGPLYRQISDIITACIHSGKLHPNEILPPERTLCEALGVSRGTVRKAYEECRINGLITVRQGGNYRVSYREGGDVDVDDRQALETTRAYIRQMLSCGYGKDAIISWVQKCMRSEDMYAPMLHVAAVECRKSIFYVYDEVLNHYRDISVSRFLVEDIVSLPDVAEKLRQCDLIITTSSHYYDLCQDFPDLEPKLMEVTFRCTDETIQELRSISHESHVGILYSNIRTVHVVRSLLRSSNADHLIQTDICNLDDTEAVGKFIRSKNILITEPSTDLASLSKFDMDYRFFISNGGRHILLTHKLSPKSMEYAERSINEELYKLQHSDPLMKERHASAPFDPSIAPNHA